MARKETTEKGLNLIAKWESLRLEPYQDSIGRWTIGFGHTRGVNENTKPITRAEAITLLKDDVKHVEMYVNSAYPKLRQTQFDAVVALLFNIGVGGLTDTKLHEYLKNDPDSKHVADEWIEFRNAGGEYLRGLLRRRLDELSLYYSW